MNPTAEAFHQLFYDSLVWDRNQWMGVPCLKNPLDLWVYQEIVWETRPELIVECGTKFGGSALYLAHLLDLLGQGRVITIDIETRPKPGHKRIRYFQGRSSTDARLVAEVGALAAPSKSTMVVLDSDHRKPHVLAELRAYHPLVSLGNFLIVEDSNVNGHPVFPGHGAGPFEAVQEFLAENRDFVVDRTREKFFMTFNPGGYLKCVKRPAGQAP